MSSTRPNFSGGSDVTKPTKKFKYLLYIEIYKCVKNINRGCTVLSNGISMVAVTTGEFLLCDVDYLML